MLDPARTPCITVARPCSVRTVVLLALVLGLLGGCSDPPDADPPNIVLYVVDTLRADSVTPYGNTVVDTPAVEALAAEGTLFENAYAQSSWTRTSMASILTSIYPEAHGAVGHEGALPESATLVSELLRNHGYHTGLVTTNPNIGSFFGFAQGFDDFVELYSRRESGHVKVTELEVTGEEVAATVRDWVAAAPRPFFLVVLSIDPHSPYQAPAEFDRYGGDYEGPADGSQAFLNRSILTTKDRERVRSLYLAEVAYSDRALGTVLEALAENGIDGNTVFAFTSDHGEEFWEHGKRGHAMRLFEESIRIPLIVRYPGRVPANRRASRAVEAVDLLPTFLDLAGVPLPDGIDGRPLFPLDAGEPTTPRRVYSSLELNRFHLVSVRAGDWKLIWNRNSGKRRLFDLARDPGETVDVERVHRQRVEELSGWLRERWRVSEERAEGLRRSGDPTRVSPDELPEDQKNLLNALGYAEEAEGAVDDGNPEEKANPGAKRD